MKDKVYIYTLSFLLPFILLLLVYISKGIFPFGDKAFLRMDLYHQYLPFHAELQYKLQNFKSLLYTYNVGLGTNFISLFAYYLSCPLNVLLLFVSKNYIIEFLGYMTIIKMALASFTFCYYIINKYKIKNIIAIAFSIFYGMSGYMGAYYWNVMWLDNVVLFPLLLLSYERVFYKNDAKMYIILLALSILCNYYIATLTCFFLIMYFIFLVFLSNQKNIKCIFKKLLYIAAYSVIGILISCILLIPIFVAFGTTASNDFSFPKSVYEFFPMLDALARHLPFVNIENGVEHYPNIYCGVCMIALVIYYFLSKKVDSKRKIIVLIMMLVFEASFCVNVVNFILHVFRYPNSLPSRFSFIYVFMILCICYVSIYKKKSIDKKNIIKSFIIAILFVVLLQSVVKNETMNFESFVVGIIFLVSYLIISLCYINKKYNKLIVLGVFIFVVCFEAFINMYSTSITTVTRSEYMKKVNATQTLNKYVDDMTKDFYRIEMDNRKSKDDGAFYNYPSASIFSSSCYKSGSDFYERMGMEASMNAYSITGSTPFMDSFLDVKYTYFDENVDKAKELNMRELKVEDGLYLYENIDTLPLSFVLNDEFIEKYEYGSGNPATAQNNIARAYNKKILLEPIPIEVNGIQADFTATDDGDYYAFVLDKSIDEINYQYKNTSKKFENTKRGYFLELGYLEKGEVCGLRNDTNEKDIQIQVFRFRFDNMKALVDRIKEDSAFDMKSYNDTCINYTLDVKVNGKAMISLPYDEGWNIKVDGIPVEKEEILDCFLGFNIDKGVHNIELSYMPKGLIAGSILSILGIILYVLYYNKEKLVLLQSLRFRIRMYFTMILARKTTKKEKETYEGDNYEKLDKK